MTLLVDAWRLKARELDRYRWRVLREEHGRLGSALRFSRDVINDVLFGLRAYFRLSQEIKAEPCDFLLLQSAPKVIAFHRKRLLMEALRQRGHSLIETALQQPKTILAYRLLARPPQRVPLRYLGYAAYAQWLVLHHRPRILLNDRNGSLYAPFLRLALNAQRGLLIHLAHATTVEGSQRLGMNDYDYYFLFGRSSLEALQRRKLRFGASTAVMAGSHMIDDAFDLAPASADRRVVLVLGVGPDKEKEPGYTRTYELIRSWAERNPDHEVLIKAHPRSRVPFWHEAADVMPNLQVLPSECGLAEALGRASIVINIMSNAVIEAALARRPVIYVNCSGQPDIFDQERFFGPCICAVDELERRIREKEVEYPASVLVAEQFAQHHLAAASHGLQQNIDLLEQLLTSGRCDGVFLPPAGLECRQSEVRGQTNE
ncbi:capsule biosynthesis protein [Stutzerimonas stutzeri]|uniref:glycosyltransferase n=1 Tax=Stutzerimonas sp. S1 TaxID=3030652 RepID=UPI0022249572|nr:capsule biosynthesis protein [Stutzerimonas sp. S1]